MLVIEDEPDLRGSIMLLSMCGCEARGAADGVEGLRVALQWRPHLVVSDVGLPSLDGLRLCRLLRQEMSGSVLLVALSGCGLLDDRERSREVGWDVTWPSRPTNVCY